jgi:hypothetical protein
LRISKAVSSHDELVRVNQQLEVGNTALKGIKSSLEARTGELDLAVEGLNKTKTALETRSAKFEVDNED